MPIKVSDTETVEFIWCPNCNGIEKATVEFVEPMPFPAYIHDCTYCGYTIMESEWNRCSESLAFAWMTPGAHAFTPDGGDKVFIKREPLQIADDDKWVVMTSGGQYYAHTIRPADTRAAAAIAIIKENRMMIDTTHLAAYFHPARVIKNLDDIPRKIKSLVDLITEIDNTLRGVLNEP